MVTHDPRAADAARHLVHLDKGQLTDEAPAAHAPSAAAQAHP
jgi:ABC-type lipoprotein export system ATPase subunit